MSRIVFGQRAASSQGMRIDVIEPPLDRRSSDGTRPQDYVGRGPAGENLFLEAMPMVVEITSDGSYPYLDGDGNEIYGRSWKGVYSQTDGTSVEIDDGWSSPSDTMPALDLNQRRDIPTGRRFVAIQSKVGGDETHLVDYAPPTFCRYWQAAVDGYAWDDASGTVDVPLVSLYTRLPQSPDRVFWVQGWANATAYLAIPQGDGGKYLPGLPLPPAGAFIQGWLSIAGDLFDEESPTFPEVNGLGSTIPVSNESQVELFQMVGPSGATKTYTCSDKSTVTIDVMDQSGSLSGSATVIYPFHPPAAGAPTLNDGNMTPEIIPAGYLGDGQWYRFTLWVSFRRNFADDVTLWFDTRTRATFDESLTTYADGSPPWIGLLQPVADVPVISPQFDPDGPPEGTHAVTVTITHKPATLGGYTVTITGTGVDGPWVFSTGAFSGSYTPPPFNLPDDTYTVTAVQTIGGSPATVTPGTFVVSGADLATSQAV